MFLFLSKLLPLFLYPAGLACVLLVAALILRNRARWRNGLIVAALLVIWLGGNRLVAMSAARTLEGQFAPLAVNVSGDVRLEEPVADAIVVLGGATREGMAPRPTNEVTEAGDRLIYAARLWKAGAAPLILVTGGVVGVQGPAGQPESESMADILGVLGVPAEAILLESAARNTFENALLSEPILEEAGAESVLLVTSAMHMPRAAAIFANAGYAFTPAPTDFFVTEADLAHYWKPELDIQLFNLVPSADDMYLTSLAMKEWIGIWIYRFRGWA